MNKIKAFREEHNLTQQKTAEIIGMPKRTLEDWEGDRRKPSEWVENLVLEKLKRHFEN